MYRQLESEISEAAVTAVLEQQHNYAWRHPEQSVWVEAEGRDLTLRECYDREVRLSEEIFREVNDVTEREIPTGKYLLFVDMVESGIPGNPMLQYIDKDRLQKMYQAETGDPDTTQDFYASNMRHCLGLRSGDERFHSVKALKEEMPTDLSDCAGIVLSGSETNIKDETDPKRLDMTQRVIELIHTAKDQNIPMFGICFGSQLLNSVFRAKVDWIRDLETQNPSEETGLVLLTKTEAGYSVGSPLAELPDQFYVHANHKQEVIRDSMPDELEILAKSETSQVQIVRMKDADTVWAIQNHIECGDTRADVAAEIEGRPYLDEKLFQGESSKARRVLFPYFLRTAGKHARS